MLQDGLGSPTAPCVGCFLRCTFFWAVGFPAVAASERFGTASNGRNAEQQKVNEDNDRPGALSREWAGNCQVNGKIPLGEPSSCSVATLAQFSQQDNVI